MSVKSSVYAIYGIAIAPSHDLGALHAALEARPAETASPAPGFVRVGLFRVGDSEHIILGTACEELEPNEYRPMSDLDVDPLWNDALLSLTERHGLPVLSGPSWLLVHDLS
ncbi:hypothetical protein [Streptomyces sp. AC555_RSS877]|uniref:hypothetical protein n=1 Tax=Streptomyces sp. AC555_RSS877 TaxID=2823688 RepID=UPI001C25914B|nr:hypothetical protein [Streptomyces sp. AC555_RSS877]